MHNMNSTSAALTGAGTNNGISFRVSAVGVVCFGVSGLTGGSITIECQPNKDGAWVDLDATNLVFTADGFGYAVIGSCNLRASGTDATTGGTLFVGIAGDYVHLN